jgi:hypothetical protein
MTELVVEFSASEYMTDTQLSRLKRIPQLRTQRTHIIVYAGGSMENLSDSRKSLNLL